MHLIWTHLIKSAETNVDVSCLRSDSMDLARERLVTSNESGIERRLILHIRCNVPCVGVGCPDNRQDITSSRSREQSRLVEARSRSSPWMHDVR